MANLSDYLFNSTAAIPATWVRLVSNTTGLGYVSTAASTSSGLFTINSVPMGSYTLYTGPTNTGPWTISADTNYLVPSPYSIIQSVSATSGNVFIDMSLGDYIKLTANGSLTIAIPSNPTTGQVIKIDLLNNTAGSITTTWVAVFKLSGGSWTDPAAGKRRKIQFTYDGSNWVEDSRSSGDI